MLIKIIKASTRRMVAMVLIFFLVNIDVTAVNIDSLRNVMATATHDAERLRAALKLALEFMPQKMDSARYLIDIATPLSESRIPLEKGEYLNTLGILHWYSGDYEAAMESFHETIKLKPSKELLPQLTMAYNNLGTLYSQSGLYDTARVYLEKALEFDIERGKISGAAKSNYDLAQLYMRLDYNHLALEKIKQAIDVQLKMNDSLRLPYSYNLLGNIYFQIDSTRHAIQNYKKVLTYPASGELISNRVLAYNNLVAAYNKLQGQSDSAKYYGFAGLQLAEFGQLQGEGAALLHNIAKTYRSEKDFRLALESNLKAYALLEKFQQPYNRAIIPLGVAESYIALGNAAAAEPYLQEGMKAAQEIKSLSSERDAFFILSSIDSLRGNFYNALHYYKKGLVIQNKIFNNQSKAIIAELEISSQKKEQDVLILNLQNRTQIIDLERKILAFASSSIALLFATFLVYHFQTRIIQKKNKELENKEREIITADLQARTQEITGHLYSLLQADNTINLMKEELEKIAGSNSSSASEIHHLLKTLKLNSKKQILWKDFENRFDELNANFINSLIKNYPSLSPAEIRLCSLLRLQLSTKEIAEITNRSTRTIDFTRNSIRRKMGLQPTDNLVIHILSI